MIAGEASGDLHGAALINELSLVDNSLKFVGIGGDKMISTGMNALYHIKDMAFLGFAEVIKHLPFILKVEKALIELVKREKIKLAVLIDYPGFNLRIAKKLKALGLKIIYYISPQIWAWRKGRINKIRNRVDKMLVVFPFEKEMYEEGNVPVNYVGHPLIERIENFNFTPRDKFYKEIGVKENQDLLLILPGSRKHEIEKHLMILSETGKILSDIFNLQTLVACAENLDETFLQQFIQYSDQKVVNGNSYNLLKYSKFGIVKSGTSTLEATLFNLPFIAIYSTSKFTYELGKRLVKIDNIAMPNIIAGKEIVKEFIQDDVNAEVISNYCITLLADDEKLEVIKRNLNLVKEKLGGQGASANAAQIILEEFHEV